MEPATGAYVRVGSTNRRADEELIAEMRRFSRSESFDERPMPNLDSEAIDFRAASESFAEFRKLARRDLDILRLCTTDRGRRVPTVGGILLFGRDRLAHFPDAWIQAGRFAGIDKANIVDRTELRMPLADAVPAAVAFIERHMASAVEIGPVRRTARWTLPPVAVREALINAVAHADYSQRGAGLGGNRQPAARHNDNRTDRRGRHRPDRQGYFRYVGRQLRPQHQRGRRSHRPVAARNPHSPIEAGRPGTSGRDRHRTARP